MIKRLFGTFTLIGVLIAAPFPAQAAPAGEPKEVTLGVLAFRPKPIVEAQWAPLVNYLNQKLPGTRTVLRALTYPEMEHAVAQRQVDFVLTQPAHYVLMGYRSGLSSPIATLVNLEGGVPLRAFGGVIVTLAERNDLRLLADLKDKKIATASRKSFGGYLMAAYELHQAGVPLPKGEQLLETGMPHDRAIDALLAGRVDAAFVRSGLLEDLLKEGKIRQGQLRVINQQEIFAFPFALSTRLYPEWPVAALPHVDEQIASNMASALLQLPHDGAVVKQMGIHGFIVPLDYYPVVDLLKALRQPPFDATPSFTPEDIWKKYQWQIATASALAFLVVVLLLLLARTNRRMHDLKNLAEEGDHRLRQFSALLPGVIFQYHLRTDGTSHFPYVSDVAQTLYGVSPEALDENAQNLFDRIHSEDRLQYLERIRKSAETMQEWRGEYRIVLDGGSVHWRLSSATPQRQPDGSILWHGYAADIDDRKAVEAHTELLVAALEANPNGVALTNIHGKIEWVNQAFADLTGYSREEVIGQNPRVLKSGKHDVAYYRNMWQTLKEGHVWRGEIINRRKDGSLSYEELTIAPVKDAKGTIHHFIGVKQDIAERKRLEEELRLQATTDALTGLANRRYFFNRAETELARIKRGKTGAATLIMLDLDHFKRVNDTHGHAIGDLLLRQVADILRDTLRRSDLPGRIGGEEFVALLPETTIQDGIKLAERLRARMENTPISVDGQPLSYTASFGVTLLGNADATVDVALARADEAMYRAKQNGRNRVDVE